MLTQFIDYAEVLSEARLKIPKPPSATNNIITAIDRVLGDRFLCKIAASRIHNLIYVTIE